MNWLLCGHHRLAWGLACALHGDLPAAAECFAAAVTPQIPGDSWQSRKGGALAVYRTSIDVFSEESCAIHHIFERQPALYQPTFFHLLSL